MHTNNTQIMEKKKDRLTSESLTWQASCVTEAAATGQEARSWGDPAHGGWHPKRWTSATTRRRGLLLPPTPLLVPLAPSTKLPLAKLTSLVQRCESMWDKLSFVSVLLKCDCIYKDYRCKMITYWVFLKYFLIKEHFQKNFVWWLLNLHLYSSVFCKTRLIYMDPKHNHVSYWIH